MSDPNANQPPSEEQTTELHLNKFAPGQAAASPPPQGDGLTLMIQRSAQDAVRQSDRPLIVPPEAKAMPAQDLLGAVSYCYAKDVYESDRIEEKMRQDPVLRQALGEEVPDAHAIRRFRRLNRQAILDTLAKAFRLKRRKDKQEIMAPLPGQPAPQQPPAPVADSENSTVIARAQAESKVENAIIIDSIEH
jgi:hypothetical protein